MPKDPGSVTRHSELSERPKMSCRIPAELLFASAPFFTCLAIIRPGLPVERKRFGGCGRRQVGSSSGPAPPEQPWRDPAGKSRSAPGLESMLTSSQNVPGQSHLNAAVPRSRNTHHKHGAFEGSSAPTTPDPETVHSTSATSHTRRARTAVPTDIMSTMPQHGGPSRS